MSVTLKPDKELTFQRPLTQLVKRSLSVSNANSQPVAFKVKTTAPKQYCVRPNSGRIEPGETVQVQVLLQPMKEDPPAGAKCRDKFLVQSVYITPDRESMSLQDLWSAAEKDGKDAAQIHEHKIRCAYEAAGDQPSSADQTAAHDEPITTNGSTTVEQAKESASNAAGAVAAGAGAGGLTGVAHSIDPSAAREAENKQSAAAPESESPPMPEQKASEKVDSTQLQSQLAAAQSEIRTLKEQLKSAQDSSSTLRNRATGASGAAATSNESAGAMTQQQQAPHVDGVPVQVVLGIAFAVFVFTWLFF